MSVYDLLDAVSGRHRVTFHAEGGEYVARCICGWEHRSTRDQTDVGRLMERVTLAGMLHTDARPPDKARTSAEASDENTRGASPCGTGRAPLSDGQGPDPAECNRTEGA